MNNSTTLAIAVFLTGSWWPLSCLSNIPITACQRRPLSPVGPSCPKHTVLAQKVSQVVGYSLQNYFGSTGSWFSHDAAQCKSKSFFPARFPAHCGVPTFQAPGQRFNGWSEWCVDRAAQKKQRASGRLPACDLASG